MVLAWIPDSRTIVSNGLSNRWRSKRTETLLSKREALKLIQAVLLGSTVDNGVLQQLSIHAVVINSSLVAGLLRRRLQLPRVSLLVVEKTRVVVAFVEILEDRREHLGLFIGQRNLLTLRIQHLVLQHGLEEW